MGPAGHEREPDRAALDELMRAFSDRGDPAADTDGEGASPPASERGRDHPPRPADVSATSDPPDEPVDGHAARPDPPAGAPAQAPVDPAADPPADPAVERVADPAAGTTGSAQPSTPAIIRIDDLGGSTEVVAPAASGGIAASAAGPPHGDPIVIAIDDEDLPDAVYVEGSLDRSSPRSIVLIEDDGSLDALAPESDRDVRRGVEPRMRERRAAVRRAHGRKRLRWVVGIVGAVLIIVIALAVLGSSLFAVRGDQVVLTGNVYTDPVRLQAVIDDLVGTPVLLVDSQAAERELEQIPWVDVARVRTDFPHGVIIEIRERAAMTTYRGPDGRFRVLDREGRVLDVIDNYPFAYVLLEGPDPVDLEPGQFAPSGYAAASELAKNLTGSVRGRVASLEVAADGSRLVMHLDGGVEVRFGEARDLFAKLVRLETVLSSGEVRDGAVVDISTSEVTL